MIKVLIADDELVVRIGLKTTIDWESHGFKIVGEAVNGKDAVDMFHKFKPDILVTDIKMPLMDGLEVIQQLKSEHYSYKALILSHYDDFDFARKAINLGASNYILKTELTEQKLLASLKQLAEQLIEERKLEPATSENISLGFPADNSAQKTRFFRKVLEGTLSPETIPAFLEQRPALLVQSCHCVACLNVEKQADSIQDVDSYQFHHALDNLSSELLVRKGWNQSIVQTANNIYYLISFSGDEAQSASTVLDTIQSLKRNIEQFLNVQLSIGVSQISKQLADLPSLIAQAKSAWLSCYFEPIYSVRLAERDISSPMLVCPALDTDFIRKSIALHDIKPALEHIDTVFDALKEANHFDYVREVFNDAISLAKMIVSERKLENATSLNDERFSYRNFDRLAKFEEVRKYILDLYTQINVGDNTNIKGEYSYGITRCIKFIRHNYQNSISLSDAADYVGISKCYLSLLFRQETGVNFSNWLANYRIEKAKKLLSETNMKIYEVAEMVGFENPYYFSKVFKELTGESCKEFKTHGAARSAR
jgi:two-component system response regulator YesN